MIVNAKITVPDILAAKGRGSGPGGRAGRRLTMVTAYDYSFTRLIDRAGVDLLLVGDSLGMVVQGEGSTLPVTLDEMAYHTRLVAKAAPRALIVGDLPFLSYQTSRRDALASAGRLVKAGAEAVKLEGGRTQAATIRALVRAEMPVVGHIGLTPQGIHRMGGHRVQGRDAASRQRVLDDARAVADAGAFAVVVEGVPLDLAREITEAIEIPTIGIGAGPYCDGQVLVMHDLLGLDGGDRPAPRFVRRYARLGELVSSAVKAFAGDVASGDYPSDAECYHAARAEASAERVRSRMTEIDSVAGMQAWADRQRSLGLRVAFVPTMGYLHEGHLSLVREARKRGDRVVVSIFVNPIQFDREEDLVSYPRDPERDRRLLEDAGVDVLFAPGPREMYPDEFVTGVGVDRLTAVLCGAHRPGHFRGVTTVVSKLFHAVKPHVAVFGEKDFQQLAVVRRMARDLDFGVEVVGAPIVREADGVALSSRNARLGAEGRVAARCVPAALDAARAAVARGARRAEDVGTAVAARIAAEPRARLEYATICSPASLEPVERVESPVQLAVAVWVNGVRLIDNCTIDPAVAEPERLCPMTDAPSTLSEPRAITLSSPASSAGSTDQPVSAPLFARASER
jgi:3-methyl-2-oxobutanoate hydroxymethyltransferase